jgi:hypothetical protein
MEGVVAVPGISSQNVETELNEISSRMKGNYMSKAMSDHSHQEMGARNAMTADDRKKHAFNRDKRAKGISKALGGHTPRREMDEMTELNYQQQHSRFSMLISNFVGIKEAFDTVKREMSEQGLDDVEIEEILSNLERDFFPNDEPDNVSGNDTGWIDRGYSGDERSFEEDIQNGYNDVKELDGNDYFPNGADGPVVKAVGPSGARHGDNPEQKKMQVAETHTELVYAYRKYLNESAVSKKKINESRQISEVKIVDMYDDFKTSSSDISYTGWMGFSATVADRQGNPVNLRYLLDISASCDVSTESDESPTGWNHRTDSETYTTQLYSVAGDVTVSSVAFSPDVDAIGINGKEYSVNDAIKVIDPAVIKQLLHPLTYAGVLGPLFDKEAEGIPPSEPDRDYSDRDDNRY